MRSRGLGSRLARGLTLRRTSEGDFMLHLRSLKCLGNCADLPHWAGRKLVQRYSWGAPLEESEPCSG